jgi:hypothetical protein
MEWTAIFEALATATDRLGSALVAALIASVTLTNRAGGVNSTVKLLLAFTVALVIGAMVEIFADVDR